MKQKWPICENKYKNVIIYYENCYLCLITCILRILRLLELVARFEFSLIQCFIKCFNSDEALLSCCLIKCIVYNSLTLLLWHIFDVWHIRGIDDDLFRDVCEEWLCIILSHLCISFCTKGRLMDWKSWVCVDNLNLFSVTKTFVEDISTCFPFKFKSFRL